jgi:hypothetical protein
LREEHEEYLGSLMSMERYDPEMQRMSIGHRDHPSRGVLRQLGTHIHMGIPELGAVMRTLPFVFQDWLTFM